MGSLLSFGNEKELFKHLIDFIKSPSQFFEKIEKLKNHS